MSESCYLVSNVRIAANGAGVGCVAFSVASSVGFNSNILVAKCIYVISNILITTCAGVGCVTGSLAGSISFLGCVAVSSEYELVAFGSSVFALFAVLSYVGGEFSALNCYLGELCSINSALACCCIVFTGLNNDFCTIVCPDCIVIVGIFLNVGIYIAVYEFNISCKNYIDTTENFNVFDSNILCYDTGFTEPQTIRRAHAIDSTVLNGEFFTNEGKSFERNLKGFIVKIKSHVVCRNIIVCACNHFDVLKKCDGVAFFYFCESIKDGSVELVADLNACAIEFFNCFCVLMSTVCAGEGSNAFFIIGRILCDNAFAIVVFCNVNIGVNVRILTYGAGVSCITLICAGRICYNCFVFVAFGLNFITFVCVITVFVFTGVDGVAILCAGRRNNCACYHFVTESRNFFFLS